MKRSTAVVLVAKAPAAGEVKTRFCPPLTPGEAAAYACAFLKDSAEAITDSRFASTTDSWCAHRGDPQLMRALLKPKIGMLVQRGKSLGDVLANAADDFFSMGYNKVVLIAADCPTVDAGYLESTLESLNTHDVVLGPAHDGGYVLIGLNRPDASLFEGIEMSTDRVLSETVARADIAGSTVKLLPTLHDLDTIGQLMSAVEAGQLDHARATLSLLRQTDGQLAGSGGCIP